MVKNLIRIFLVLSFFFSFFLSSIFAQSENDLAKDYEKLKKIPANYQTFGSICEQVARLRLKEKFDKRKI